MPLADHGCLVAGMPEETRERGAAVLDQAGPLCPKHATLELGSPAVAAGEQAGRAEIEADRQLLENGGTDPQRPAGLALYLASARSDGLSGRLLSAVWDPWEHLDVDSVMASEAFTVRRLRAEEG